MNETAADVVVIGAGPAGLAAALEAAQRNVQVLLVDDNPQTGGQIWRNGPNARPHREALRLQAALREAGNVRVLVGTRVVSTPGQGCLLLEMADGSLIAGFGALILCTGARELLLPFPGWILPGVTGAGGLQALIKSGYDIRGDRVLVAGSGPLLLATARLAAKVGARVERIVEQASFPALARFAGGLWNWPSKMMQAMLLATVRYRWGTHVVEALGDQRLEAVLVRDTSGRQRTISCDRLACGYGLVPNHELGALLGCEMHGGAIAVDERQATSRPGIFAAGECTGIGGKELAIVEGRIAGAQAAGETAVSEALLSARRHWQGFAHALTQGFALDAVLRNLAGPDTIVCRCEDVPRQVLDGETDWTQAKLMHRCGMGACQGRICGPATEIMYGWRRSVPRSPIFPARVETLARSDIGTN